MRRLKGRWASREMSARFLALGTESIVQSQCDKNRIDFRGSEILKNLVLDFLI